MEKGPHGGKDRRKSTSKLLRMFGSAVLIPRFMLQTKIKLLEHEGLIIFGELGRKPRQMLLAMGPIAHVISMFPQGDLHEVWGWQAELDRDIGDWAGRRLDDVLITIDPCTKFSEKPVKHSYPREPMENL